MKKVNYGSLPTEQVNPRSRKIDLLSVSQILDLINREDQTVPAQVAKVKKQIARGVEIIVKSVRSGGRVYMVGAGTSGRLAVLESAECPPTFNTPPSLIQSLMAGGRRAVFRSQEGAEDRLEESYSILRKKLKKQDVVVGVAASGVTPFVLGAFKAAREKKAAAIMVSCNPDAPVRGLSDCLIAVRTGPEVIAGSTRLKAGTATKLVLNMLTVTSMVRLGKVYENWMVDLQPRSKKLKARAIRLIQHLGRVPEEKAGDFLLRARNRVKTAILMARTGWDRKKAAAALKKNSGFLKKTLNSRAS